MTHGVLIYQVLDEDIMSDGRGDQDPCVVTGFDSKEAAEAYASAADNYVAATTIRFIVVPIVPQSDPSLSWNHAAAEGEIDVDEQEPTLFDWKKEENA